MKARVEIKFQKIEGFSPVNLPNELRKEIVLYSLESTFDPCPEISKTYENYFSQIQSEKRKKEFLRTRWLVKHICNFEPEYIPGRAPVWPKGLVGSITHKNDHVVIALASSKQFQSIGIDLEFFSLFKPHLAEKILTPNELKRFTTLEEQIKVFSVKEALFKCHYVIGEKPFYFQDAEMREDTIENLISTSSKTPAGFLTPFRILSKTDSLLALVYI